MRMRRSNGSTCVTASGSGDIVSSRSIQDGAGTVIATDRARSRSPVVRVTSHAPACEDDSGVRSTVTLAPRLYVESARQVFRKPVDALGQRDATFEGAERFWPTR